MSALISIGADTEGGYWYSVTDSQGEWFAGGSSPNLCDLTEIEIYNAIRDLEAAGWSAAIPVDDVPTYSREEGEAAKEALNAEELERQRQGPKAGGGTAAWASSKAPLEPVATIAGVQIDAGVHTGQL